jgi:hypothetical protein
MGDWTGVISVVAKAPKSAASMLLGRSPKN